MALLAVKTVPPTHLLLFDIDGTLLTVDEERAFADAFRERTGRTPDMDWERYRSCTDWGITAEILEEHLGREANEEEIEDALALFVRHLRRNTASGTAPYQVTPGAIDFVGRVAADGCALGLATWCIEASARAKVEAVGLGQLLANGGYGDRRFDRISVLRAGIEEAQARHGVQFAPDHICYFGDRRWDAEAAQELGIRFIGVALTEDARARLTTAGAERIIGDFGELAGPGDCFVSPRPG